MDNQENGLDGMVEQVRGPWHRYLDLLEPLRPELFRYCRSLTRSAWDAEDLVQDALARGFVTLGGLFQEIRSPRAWLFRVASNLWIDRQRRPREEPSAGPMAEAATAAAQPGEARDAGATLIGRLSPQERAAVLLKDVFDFTLEEIAEMLGTTPNAIKAALHRGRGKLAEPDPEEPRRISPAVLDAFVEAFNARDVGRLTTLLLETATAEIPGISTEYSLEKMKRTDTGSLHHSLFSPISHAVQPAFLRGYRGGTPRAEVRDCHGEPVVVCWYDHDEGPAVRDVIRFQAEADRITAIRYHFFSPDVLGEVCGDLGVPWRSNGYRYWPREE